MNGKKVLLLAPFIMATLASCGGGGGKKTIDYEEAKKLSTLYAESIGNNRASKIIVNGNVNALTIDGDVTFWNYMSTQQKVEAGGFLQYIPNISEKGMNVTVDKQKLAELYMPALLNSFTGSSGVDTEEVEDLAFWAIANLPKFPMSERLLWVINGIDKDTTVTEPKYWYEAFKESPWENAKATYYLENGGIGVDVRIESFAKFVAEITRKTSDDTPKYEESLDFPIDLSLSCNKIGYINSLSVKFTSEENIFFEKWINSDIMYLYFNAKVDVDMHLVFDQEFTKTTNIAYRVSKYKYKTPGDETSELVFDSMTDYSTNLDDFKDYFTVYWKGNDSEEKVFDDPLFKYNYWRERATNIAYVGEEYYVSIVPKQKDLTKEGDEEPTYAPYYDILGYESKGHSTQYPTGKNTLNKLSSSGLSIDIDQITGGDNDSSRVQYPAAEQMWEYKLYYATKDKKVDYVRVDCCNFYINPTMMSDNNGQFLIDIAVFDNGLGE